MDLNVNKPFRVLVTGSRDWEDEVAISMMLGYAQHQAGGYYTHLRLVHGACPTGADAIAEKIVKPAYRWSVEPHPADWKTYGKPAGPKRNQEMVDLGADLCLAFIRNDSGGASGTADMAEAAGIKTIRVVINDKQ